MQGLGIAVIGVLGITALAVGADSDLQVYHLRSYPVAASNCHQTAKDLGAQFATATGLVVESSRCLPSTSQGPVSGFDIRIRYHAEKPIKPVSTEANSYGSVARGRFPNEATCRSALTGKKQEFETHTGVAAQFAYCLKVSGTAKHSWDLRIDGFGSPKLSPRFNGYYMFSVPAQLTMAQFSQGIAEGLAANGAVLSDASIHGSAGFASVGIHYYAEQQLAFTLVELTKSKSLAECGTAIPELVSAFQKTDNPAALVYCGHVTITGVYEGTVLIVGQSMLTARHSIENYPSFESCEAARPGLVKYYQTELQADVRASACSRNHATYEVVFLEPA